MREQQSDRPKRSAWDEAAAEGIDMSLIEDSLRRTPMERAEIHERVLALALELREAMQKRNDSA